MGAGQSLIGRPLGTAIGVSLRMPRLLGSVSAYMNSINSSNSFCVSRRGPGSVPQGVGQTTRLFFPTENGSSVSNPN